MYGDEGKGSGRTTSQMKALPMGGVYVVAHREEKDYCKRLQKHIGREDIMVLLPNEVWDYGQGRFISGYDVDHDVYDRHMNAEQRHRLEASLRFLNSRKTP